MSAGMAEVIAAHSGYGAYPHEDDDAWYVECDDCDWRELLTYGNTDHAAHAAHVADALTKAGYGKLAPHGVD